MTPDEEDVRALTADVCQTLLGFDVQPAGGEAAAVAEGSRLLRGRIVVSGAWHGAVSIGCTASFAEEAAVHIFEGADAVSPDDVRDALGELANIIGGGVKGLMPSPSRLSLPVVSHTDGWRDDTGTGPTREIWFECPSGERFVVTVSAAEKPAPPSQSQPSQPGQQGHQGQDP
jgi:chemotaxis protein CheX